LKLAQSRRQIFSDRENSVQLRDDEKLLDLVVHIADGSVATAFAAFGENIYKYIQPVTVQVFEITHADNETVCPLVNEILHFIQQRRSLRFVDQIAIDLNNGIISFRIYFIVKVHGVKIMVFLF
jgi:hypothetical protein